MNKQTKVAFLICKFYKSSVDIVAGNLTFQEAVKQL